MTSRHEEGVTENKNDKENKEGIIRDSRMIRQPDGNIGTPNPFTIRGKMFTLLTSGLSNHTERIQRSEFL